MVVLTTLRAKFCDCNSWHYDEVTTSRKGDVLDLIRAVKNEDDDRPVTVVVCDNLTTDTVKDVKDFKVISINATKIKMRDPTKPTLGEIMETSYERSPTDGKQVDYALSDFSSPAWNVNMMVLTMFVPYIKTKGKAFIHSPPMLGGSTTLYSGGTYFQNPVKTWHGNPRMPHLEMTITTAQFPGSPLPH